MSAIVIEGLSPTALAVWERRAAAKNRTIQEEVKLLLEEGARAEFERLPMYVPSPEDPGVFTLPYTSEGIPVQPAPGGKRWPDRPISDDDLR